MNVVAIRRILCPIDFSEHALQALGHAVAFARWYAARLTVLHVEAMPLPIVPPPGTAAVMPPLAARDTLIEQVRRFCAPHIPSELPWEAVLREGGVTAQIVEHADTTSPDLLVMGTHGRSGLQHLVLGSVTEKVLRLVQCPVLVTPARAPGAEPGPPTYSTVLCPLDFSDASSRALQYALSLIQLVGARLILLHVVEGIDDPADLREAAHFSVPEYHRHLERNAMERLRTAVPADTQATHVLETRVASGKASREIVRVAAEVGARLIVMGVQGRGAVDRLLFGSTTHHVIRHVTSPVLTLRA